MIWESSYWKDELLRIAGALRRRENQARWVPASFARVEQSVMMGFYSVRKLLEAHKTCTGSNSMQLRLTRFPCSATVHRINWHDLSGKYDFSHGAVIHKSLRYVCDQFIHSYVFSCSLDDRGLNGVYVSSDRERSKFLYLMPLREIIRAFETVGNDYPAEVAMRWNDEKQDYEIIAKRRVMPPTKS